MPVNLMPAFFELNNLFPHRLTWSAHLWQRSSNSHRTLTS